MGFDASPIKGEAEERPMIVCFSTCMDSIRAILSCGSSSKIWTATAKITRGRLATSAHRGRGCRRSPSRRKTKRDISVLRWQRRRRRGNWNSMTATLLKSRTRHRRRAIKARRLHRERLYRHLLTRLCSLFEASENAGIDQRQKAERNVDYYDNKQWTEDEVRALAQSAAITGNRINAKSIFFAGWNVPAPTRMLYRGRRHEDDAHSVTDALRFVAN